MRATFRRPSDKPDLTQTPARFLHEIRQFFPPAIETCVPALRNNTTNFPFFVDIE